MYLPRAGSVQSHRGKVGTGGWDETRTQKNKHEVGKLLGNFYTIAPAVDNGENDPEKLQVLLSPIVAMVLAKKSLSSMFTEGLPFMIRT